jgi:hypothetical protein
MTTGTRPTSLHRNVGAGAGLVFHHQRLAQAGLHHLADAAGNQVHRAAGREADQHLDGLGRIGLRQGLKRKDGGDDRQHTDRAQPAAGQEMGGLHGDVS